MNTANTPRPAPRRRHLAPLAVLLPLLSACGVSVRTTPFSQSAYPPRPEGSPVQMYSTRTPECPYVELGLVRAEPESSITPWENVVDTFLARVRSMGGDAVVLRQGVELRDSGDGDLVNQEYLAGTAIRFERDDCRR